jgi:hypothetical protein
VELMNGRLRHILCAISIALIAGACANAGKLEIPDPVPDDRRSIPQPDNRKINHLADGWDKQVSRRWQRAFDLSRHFRSLTGNPKQSMNVDAFDEVPNSSWFTNRNHVEPLSIEALKRGANRGEGPETTGPWTVIGAKTEGVTPGFTIKDARGGRYIIKFDPPGYEEMATGAEVIGSRLFYAAGYNTPENYLVHFKPDIVRLGEGVTLKEKGKKRPMVQADLDGIIARLTVRPDGTVRAVASRFLEGKIIGPFRYHGTRKDDPNDIFPHEHRRDLRGLHVISAWLNHYDTKANNSLDVYVEEEGRAYVRHYLIDFGSCMGSQGDEPMPRWVGYENTVDTDQMFINTVGLGVYVPRWEKDRQVVYPSIGLFDWETFEPDHYKSIIPNPAFVNLTDRDGYWGAKIVASFTDEQIRAAVSVAEYSNPEAAAYLTDVLIKRRDIIARYWFARMSAVDRFAIENTAEGYALTTADLAVECGIVSPAERRYEYELFHGGASIDGPRETGYPLRVQLPSDKGGTVTVRVRTATSSGKWARAVHAFVEASPNPGAYRLIAVQRED